MHKYTDILYCPAKRKFGCYMSVKDTIQDAKNTSKTTRKDDERVHQSSLRGLLLNIQSSFLPPSPSGPRRARGTLAFRLYPWPRICFSTAKMNMLLSTGGAPMALFCSSMTHIPSSTILSDEIRRGNVLRSATPIESLIGSGASRIVTFSPLRENRTEKKCVGSICRSSGSTNMSRGAFDLFPELTVVW